MTEIHHAQTNSWIFALTLVVYRLKGTLFLYDYFLAAILLLFYLFCLYTQLL